MMSGFDVANLPWLANAFEGLLKQLNFDRLPHAMLLYGQSGIGKHAVANQLAQKILCHSPVSHGACGQCKSCQLFAAESHPDFLSISPESSAVIKVDQIRKTIDFAYQTSGLNHSKVILLHPASAMNHNAENALLKCLEEPVENTYFILITEQLSQLLPTTVSRCRKFLVDNPDEASVLNWLQSQHPDCEQELIKMVLDIWLSNPLAANAFLQSQTGDHAFKAIKCFQQVLAQQLNVIDFAAQLEKESLEFYLLLTIYIIRSYIKRHTAQADSGQESLRPFEAYLTQDKLQTMFKFLAWSEQSYAQVASGSNLNKVMMAEKLLIHWSQLAL